ncbi:MAG: DUF2752 domain-containing protein [bacterium]
MGILKKFLSKLFTLSDSYFRFFIFVFVLIFLLVLPFEIIEKTHNFSICSKIFGKYCYSVGITRGVSLLLKGDFSKAIEYNFLCIPVLLILLGFIFYDLFKILKSRKLKK